MHICPDPLAVVLDGLEISLSEADATRLRELAPRLDGRTPLEALPGRDADLVETLTGAGVVFPLQVSGNTVNAAQFTDYLYAWVAGWRQRKNPARWPWRGVITRGEARISYMQGILVENFHYVRAASVRQSPLLAQASTNRQFDLVRGFVTEEAAHEGFFAESLSR